ncbi:MAG: class I SAM-dependent methyltransferase [Ignavibacteria bacterium]|nr:class I SAM-dependent methyltransferase [Ignavibacteria bacterium]MBI3766625.1 class I SAM-dependent methyltransferase [Ignavibacteriales bacterium]
MNTAEEQLYRDIWNQKIIREAANLAADGEQRGSAALKMIEGGDRFLDIGCGEGTLAMQVQNRFKEVHGIDISEDAVRLANQNGVKATRVNLNIEPIPYPDNYFDTVVSLDVIEHVFDPIRFLKEIHRVLRRDGYTIISTPNIRKIQRILELIRGRFPRTSYDPIGFDGGHLHYFTSKDMKVLLEQHAFTVTLLNGICGDRRTWKYRLAVALLGRGFEKEFLASGILVKATKG